jgi:hypothetical protein
MHSEAEDALRLWRRSDRVGTRTAVITVVATLTAMLVAATLPLWVGVVPVRTALLGTYSGTSTDWLWSFSSADAWWAIGVVLVVPVLCTVVGALRSRQRLADAERRMPMIANLSTVGTALSAGQRDAQLRNRRADLAATQRRFTEQNRRRVSVWTILGAAFSVVLGGWFLIGIALSVSGATATPTGAWIAAFSWWVLVAAGIGCSCAIAVVEQMRGSRARGRRPADPSAGSGTGGPTAPLG